MKIIFNDFFSDFDQVRQAFDWMEYETLQNPVDSQYYEGICPAIPDDIALEAIAKIEQMLGRHIHNPTLFARLSTQNAELPHGAHNDVSMGEMSAMIYMNRAEDCAGGTEFVKHNSGVMEKGPTNEIHKSIWHNEQNQADCWTVTDFVSMQPNKCLMFDSRYMHRPCSKKPKFGTDNKTGRLVLVCFFSL